MRGVTVEIEGTPVAMAAMAVAGIVAVSYSPISPQARILAIGALGHLAGAAGGIAMPQASRRRSEGIAVDNWGHAPASNPPEWGERV